MHVASLVSSPTWGVDREGASRPQGRLLGAWASSQSLGPPVCPHSPDCQMVSAQEGSQGYHSLSGQFAVAFMRLLLYTSLAP